MRGGQGAILRRVDYVVGEHPMADILALSGGLGSPIFVIELLTGGIAECAGIRVGHELVGVASFPKFREHRASELIALLPTPTTLIFCEKPRPKPAPTSAEARIVRHNRTDDIGLSAATSVCAPSTGKFKLLDEVSFQPTAALWLTSPRPSGHQGLCELRRVEAQRLVAAAKNQASDPSSNLDLDQWFKRDPDSFWSSMIPDCPDELDAGADMTDITPVSATTALTIVSL
eukprot:gnl/MRDRNA2_/MRDRNA2_24683_c0_seq1.p1 gnl/MRDRNA2_/MRDRNA2_24683_c0~~gnl/MRDRNA2_/MRDRNA2_24683_c0_seq1.p1  ORF type:complete len:230 (+),score=21.96 gnl/MRDRNA2_/MRDRNA2_24683_c0_seq1:169-858(+)